MKLNELGDLEELTKGDRKEVKISSTNYIHIRDVVSKMIQQKTALGSTFLWQFQLRNR